MSKHNGHKNWNHWNVSLWLNNDEWLYITMREYMTDYRTKDKAAEALVEHLVELGFTRTPDGAPYSFSSIRAAMSD